jgi:hypothetical protein
MMIVDKPSHSRHTRQEKDANDCDSRAFFAESACLNVKFMLL